MTTRSHPEMVELRRLYREIGKACRPYCASREAQDRATTAIWDQLPKLPVLPYGTSQADTHAAYRVYGAAREKVIRKLVDPAILDQAEQAEKAYHDACDAFIDAPARTPQGIAYKLRMMVKAGDDWADCEGVVRNLIEDLGKLDDWPSPGTAPAAAAVQLDAGRRAPRRPTDAKVFTLQAKMAPVWEAWGASGAGGRDVDDKIGDRWWSAFRRLLALPAKTPEGMLAKLTEAARLYPPSPGGDPIHAGFVALKRDLEAASAGADGLVTAAHKIAADEQVTA